ncbi:MAG TPA: HEAT repeat domain-containing protein [Gemmatimonadaceae bacterium]|nr:HEAT repeat domain-containing protein [Gemmatimonadaceae bacterium]
MIRSLSIPVVLAAAALAGAPPRAAAQSLAERVASAPGEVVEFHFASRPGVCGDGHHFIALGQSMFMGSSSGEWGDAEWRQECVPGPVRVVVTRHEHHLERIRAYAGPLPAGTATGVTDLGNVPASDAAAYLLSLAKREDGSVSEQAILPAVLADSAVVWPRLLAIARDDTTRGHSTRQTAAFWLGRFAAAALTHTTLGAPRDEDGDIEDGTTDADVRGEAVFALSQLKHHAGVPSLIRVARTNAHPHLRRTAVFWLSQSGDSRALDFFEAVLRASGR